MARYTIESETLTNIADAIRDKTGSIDTMTPPEMPGLIEGLETKAEFKKVKLPPVEQYGAVGYGGGKYVAIASNGVAAYSENGVNWTQTTIPSFGTVYDVTYGNGVYVAVGFAKLAYSTDCITWTECASITGHPFRSVCYGNGMFLAGSIDGFLFSSVDGISWTQVGSQYSYFGGNPCQVDYGGGMFVITRVNGGFMYSTDGINWKSDGVTPYIGAVAACYGAGKFVALGCYGGAYSADGINWIVTDLPFEGYTDYISVSYGNSVFVAVYGGAGYSRTDMSCLPYGNKVAYSTDGINWQVMNMPSSQDWKSVCYGEGSFIAVAGNGVAARSADGMHWTEFSMPCTPFSRFLKHVCHGMRWFVAADTINGTLYKSHDGHWWQSMTGKSDLGTLQAMCYGHEKFVCLFKQGDVWASAYHDGWYWPSQTAGSLPTTTGSYKLCYGDGKFVAVAGAGVAAYSTDGINWTQTAMPLTATCEAVSYGSDSFCAICEDGTTAHSNDGINWTEGTAGDADGWEAICYGKAIFVAVAKGGIVAYDVNGYNRFADSAALPTSWRTNNTVCYGSGLFVAMGYDYDDDTQMPIPSDVCAISEDGANWNTVAVPSEYWQEVCYGDGKFVALCGDYGNSEIAVCDVTKPLK